MVVSMVNMVVGSSEQNLRKIFFVLGLLGGDAGNSIPTSCSCTNGTEISPPFRSAPFAVFSLFGCSIQSPYPLSPIYLHLIFDILEFDELSFFPYLNWIFAGYAGSKNPVKSREKIQFIKLEISN